MGGTSIIGTGPTRPLVQPFGEWNTRASETVPDTLLGPEGTGNRSFETDAREPCGSWAFRSGPGPRTNCPACRRQAPRLDQESRPYLENCTVDASI